MKGTVGIMFPKKEIYSFFHKGKVQIN